MEVTITTTHIPPIPISHKKLSNVWFALFRYSKVSHHGGRSSGHLKLWICVVGNNLSVQKDFKYRSVCLTRFLGATWKHWVEGQKLDCNYRWIIPGSCLNRYKDQPVAHGFLGVNREGFAGKGKHKTHVARERSPHSPDRPPACQYRGCMTSYHNENSSKCTHVQLWQDGGFLYLILAIVLIIQTKQGPCCQSLRPVHFAVVQLRTVN